MIQKQSWSYIILGFCVIMITTYVGNNIKQSFENKDTVDDYEMVKKYLLNDAALYGNNRPKL